MAPPPPFTIHRFCILGNPTGVMIPRGTLDEASRLCASHGVWLVADSRQEHFSARVMSGSCPGRVLQVVDNTYEHFQYAGEAISREAGRRCSGPCPGHVSDTSRKAPHECVSGEHVINVFSFSKAFGMMGWRVGCVSAPRPTEGTD